MVIRDGVVLYSQAGALPQPALQNPVQAVRDVDMDDVKKKLCRGLRQRPPMAGCRGAAAATGRWVSETIDLRGRDFPRGGLPSRGTDVSDRPRRATQARASHRTREAAPARSRPRADLREDIDANTSVLRGSHCSARGFSSVLDPSSSQIGHKESTADTARVLSRVLTRSNIAVPTMRRVELAQHATVPVFNG